ncbi:Serine/threonine-protein kinase PknD [compost metagenome]
MRNLIGVMTAATVLAGCTAYSSLDALRPTAALLAPAPTPSPKDDPVPLGPPQVSTYAGSTPGDDNGTLATATFFAPHALVRNATGDIFVSDPTGRIRRIDTEGNVSTFVGKGDGLNTPGIGTGASIYAPIGLALDSHGNLFAVSNSGNRILKITPSAVQSLFAGIGLPGATDGSGDEAEFRSPAGLCIDAQDNLYVADSKNHRIRKVTPSGHVSTVAGSTEGYSDAKGSAAQFKAPYGLTIDASGNLYVADTGNKRIRKITPDGTVSTVAGTGASGSEDAPASSATFEEPLSLAFAPDGSLFVSDGSRLRKIRNGQVTTVAGSDAGFEDGTAAQAKFEKLYGLLFLADDSLLVADWRNHRIRRLDFPTAK